MSSFSRLNGSRTLNLLESYCVGPSSPPRALTESKSPLLLNPLLAAAAPASGYAYNSWSISWKFGSFEPFPIAIGLPCGYVRLTPLYNPCDKTDPSAGFRRLSLSALISYKIRLVPASLPDLTGEFGNIESTWLR